MKKKVRNLIISLTAFTGIVCVQPICAGAEEETAIVAEQTAEASVSTPDITDAPVWSKDAEGRIFCANADGTLMTGVCEIEGQKYIFSQNGALKTGWRTIEGKRFYFDEKTGKAVSGELEYCGKNYRIDGENGKTTGLYTDNKGEKYLYTDNGAAGDEEFVRTEEGLYYADESGKAVTGIFEFDENEYIADENGLVQTGVYTVNGIMHSAEEDGTPTEGVREYEGESYYFRDGTMETGLKRVNGRKMHFSEEDGKLLYGWQSIDGKDYYAGEDGAFCTGVTEVDGLRRRFGSDGALDPVKICLDAGHFAKYNHSPVNSAYWESDFTWKFHLMLKEELEKRGISVITTREDKEIDMDLKERGYASKGCDLFISVHSNASSSYYDDSPDAYCAVSGICDDIGLILAQTIANTMGTYQAGRVCHKIGKYGDWYSVLYGAAVVGTPAILLEHSYHTNYRATQWLLNDNNLRNMAIAEAEALYNFYLK